MEGLLDTACLAGDFVARRIVEKYNQSYNPLDDTCYDMSKSVTISVIFFMSE